MDELFGFGASQRQGEPEFRKGAMEDGEAGAQHNEQEFRKGEREEGGGRCRQAHSTTSRNSGRVRGRSRQAGAQHNEQKFRKEGGRWEEAGARHNEQVFRKGERQERGSIRTAQRTRIQEG